MYEAVQAGRAIRSGLFRVPRVLQRCAGAGPARGNAVCGGTVFANTAARYRCAIPSRRAEKEHAHGNFEGAGFQRWRTRQGDTAQGRGAVARPQGSAGSRVAAARSGTSRAAHTTQEEGERQPGSGAQGDVSRQRSGVAVHSGETAGRLMKKNIPSHHKENTVNTRKLYLLVISAALISVSLSGCNRGPDPAKVREDVAKAQADGQKKIADAQAKLDKAMADSRKDAVTDQNANNGGTAATGAGTPAPGTAPANNGDAKKVA